MTTEYLYHTVDAAHIRNIGEQSVSNKIQAVLEIVKNAYDADSKKCKVIFVGEKIRHKKIAISKIIIEDDGIGMTKKDLKNKFMKVGTGSKIRETLSPKFNRRVSGEKGMGHYSVQRLGNKVKITTTPEKYKVKISTNPDKFKVREFTQADNCTYILEMDWEQYQEGKEFEKIGNKLEVLKKQPNFGTTIEISNLKDEWNATEKNNDLLILARNFSSLVLPKDLQTGTKTSFQPKVETSGFELEIPLPENNFLDYARFKISAKLRKDKITYSVFERKKESETFTQLPGESEVTIKDVTCGDVDVDISWFPGTVREWAPGAMKVRFLKEQLDESHGIKIYNDKIRVMPYGEKNNDWLGLDTRKAGPASGGKVRNDHLVGFVKLSREKNPKIVETTTREAIKENAEFGTLKQKIIMRCITILEKAAGAVEKELDEKIQHGNKAITEIEHVKDNLPQEKIEPVTKQEYVKSLTTAITEIKLSEKDKKVLVEELKSNIEMYRNLSTVGIQTLAFNHEIINPIRFIKWNLSLLVKDKKISKEIVDTLVECLKQAENSLDWANFIKEFSSLLAGANKARKTSIINLEKMLKEIKNGFEPIFNVSNIVLESEITSKNISLKMNRASLESIFINMISNSIRALKKVEREREKKIKIKISKIEPDIVFEFEDNGYGIPDEDKAEIFDPFFTTYTDEGDKGTGMGLAIIKEIVHGDYKGEVYLEKTISEESHDGKGMTKFVIKIPKKEVQN